MVQLKSPSDSRYIDSNRDAELDYSQESPREERGEFDDKLEHWAECLDVEKILNTTPHPIVFQREDGTEFTVNPCGFVLNAEVIEEVVQDRRVDFTFVRPKFVPNNSGLRFLHAVLPLQRKYKGVIVGSIIAAQAYAGLVCALTPAKGFERVPVDQKRMNPKKFTIF